jgi:hypothetical protein
VPACACLGACLVGRALVVGLIEAGGCDWSAWTYRDHVIKAWGCGADRLQSCHAPDCSSLPAEEVRSALGGDEAEEAGGFLKGA